MKLRLNLGFICSTDLTSDCIHLSFPELHVFLCRLCSSPEGGAISLESVWYLPSNTRKRITSAKNSSTTYLTGINNVTSGAIITEVN